MVKGLILCLVLMWISAASDSHVYGNEHHMDQQDMKPLRMTQLCRTKLDGKCIKKGKKCPNKYYLEKPAGQPYCSKKRLKCCYKAKEITTPNIKEITTPKITVIITPQKTTPKPTEVSTTPKPAEINKTTSSNTVRCAPGFFALGDECFQVSLKQVQWGIARVRCENIDRGNTFLAEPKDSAALAQHVFDNYDDDNRHHYWMGGRGVGSRIKWNHSGGTVSLKTEPWQADQPSSFNRRYCLDLRLDSNPLSRPLAVHKCRQALNHCYICESSLRL